MTSRGLDKIKKIGSVNKELQVSPKTPKIKANFLRSYNEGESYLESQKINQGLNKKLRL